MYQRCSMRHWVSLSSPHLMPEMHTSQQWRLDVWREVWTRGHQTHHSACVYSWFFDFFLTYRPCWRQPASSLFLTFRLAYQQHWVWWDCINSSEPSIILSLCMVSIRVDVSLLPASYIFFMQALLRTLFEVVCIDYLLTTSSRPLDSIRYSSVAVNFQTSCPPHC